MNLNRVPIVLPERTDPCAKFHLAVLFITNSNCLGARRLDIPPIKNRAKCKLCKDILESFHQHDYVTCTCGEISIDGGTSYWRCAAKNWENFLRLDDNGN